MHIRKNFTNAKKAFIIQLNLMTGTAGAQGTLQRAAFMLKERRGGRETGITPEEASVNVQ